MFEIVQILKFFSYFQIIQNSNSKRFSKLLKFLASFYLPNSFIDKMIPAYIKSGNRFVPENPLKSPNVHRSSRSRSPASSDSIFTILVPDARTTGVTKLIDLEQEHDTNLRTNSGVAQGDREHSGHGGIVPAMIRQSATRILASVASIGSTMLQTGIEMAQTMLRDVQTFRREEVLKLNGFKMTVSGNSLTLESVHLNGGEGQSLVLGDKTIRLQVRVGSEVTTKQPHTILEDNKLKLTFPTFDSFIEILAPLGINSEAITYSIERIPRSSERFMYVDIQ